MTKGTICVVGASGLVGSNITKEALARGYSVKGTFRDVTDPTKAPYLLVLPEGEHLELFSADMANPGAFNPLLENVDCVFIASLIPTYFGPAGKPAREMEDEQGYQEIVRPTLDGCLNILESAHGAGVKDVVICSSTSSTNPIPPVLNKNEVDHWSSEQEQYSAKKYTSAAKTVMEKAAIQFTADRDMRLSILLPTLMLGPAIIPEHANRGFMKSLANMVAGEPPSHQKIPNDSNSMIHVDDLANLFLAAYENPQARGRYFGVYDSWPWQRIYAAIAELLPDAPMPEPLREPMIDATSFDFIRRDSLGVPVRDIPTILKDTISWLQATGAAAQD